LQKCAACQDLIFHASDFCELLAFKVNHRNEICTMLIPYAKHKNTPWQLGQKLNVHISIQNHKVTKLNIAPPVVHDWYNYRVSSHFWQKLDLDMLHIFAI
jgi:hypothetical protein